METKVKVKTNNVDKENKTRAKIANFVRRKPEINTDCCICGKKGTIVHSKTDNPYFITFLCWKCRQEPENLIIAEQYRVDVRTLVNKQHIHISHYTDSQINDIVVKYMNSLDLIGEFCEKEGLSRFQFNTVIERYKKLHPKQNIENLMKIRTKKIRKYVLGGGKQ